MKRNRYKSANYNQNRIKKPSAVWFAVFGAVLLLFAVFIFIGIKAGEKAQRINGAADTVYSVTTYGENE